VNRTLSLKQRLFASEYNANGGNGLQAAKKAGYSGDSNTLGQRAHELVNNSKVKAYIEAETAKITAINNIKIKTRLERQAFWSNMMDNAGNDADKLRASELLGKSEADFTDNLNTAQSEQAKALSEQEQLEAARLANIRLRTG
jgi:hypothetical protein